MSNKTKIRTENGWHIDANNNRWNADNYTIEQAEALSKTLIDCSDCENCSDCQHCRGCRSCSYCVGWSNKDHTRK